VAHNVSVIVLPARGGRRSLLQSPAEGRQVFDSIESAGQQALVELRRLLGIVRADGEAPEFAPQPGLRNLDTLVRGVRDAGLPVTVRIEGRPLELPAGVDLAAYRVIQEGLTNSLKHAGAAEADVVVATRTPPWNSSSAMTAAGRSRVTVPAGEWWACVSESCPRRIHAKRRPTRRRFPHHRPPPGNGGLEMTIRVLLADDERLIRTGFRMILRDEPDIEVVSEAADGTEVVKIAADVNPPSFSWIYACQT
jgi:hypothetical protein